jgi:hypothetical protein
MLITVLTLCAATAVFIDRVPQVWRNTAMIAAGSLGSVAMFGAFR